MKKILAFTAAVALFAGMASAQLGVHVSYAPQTLKTTYTNPNNGNVTNYDPLEMGGFNAGIDFNANIKGDLNVLVGLQAGYYNKTTTSSTNLAVVTYNDTTVNKQFAIEVPVLVNYGLKLGNDIKVSPFAGLTVQYALSGSTEYKGNASALGALNLGGGNTDDWYTDNGVRYYGNFNLSLTFGAAVTYTEFRLYAGYNMGLLNLDKADNFSTKSSGWFIGLGYAI